MKLLEHKENKKIRLVMRRDKTLKVCANHSSQSRLCHFERWVGIDAVLCLILVTLEMKLQPNIGSDRSWVWKVTADYAETPPTVETLAIRFANSESE